MYDVSVSRSGIALSALLLVAPAAAPAGTLPPPPAAPLVLPGGVPAVPIMPAVPGALVAHTLAPGAASAPHVSAQASAITVPDPWIITTPVTVTAPMDVGNVIVADGGSLTVTGLPDPGLRITGNLYVIGTGRVLLADSVIQVMSVFHGQYIVAAGDEGSITIERCDYRVPNGVQHGLIATGSARIALADTVFAPVQLLANQHGSIDAERLDGSFEVILQEPGSITLTDIPRTAGDGTLWVWPEFPPGSVAVYSPPLPGFTASWTFPPAGATGIEQSCRITRCQVKLWPMLVREGSDLTVRDVAPENWVIIGILLPNDAAVSGLVDGETYASMQLPLADRRLAVENATIHTWNLYPESGATVSVSDSVIGEMIAADTAAARLDGVTVDGSGGYFGANGSASIEAAGSTFTCDVQVSASATVELHGSRVLPYPVDTTGAYTHFGAYDDGRLLLDATPATSTARLAGRGVVAGVALADVPARPPAPGITLPLYGTVALYSLDPATAAFAWRLEALAVGSGAPQLLGQGIGAVSSGLLGTWRGTQPRATYDLRTVITDGLGRDLVARTVVPGIRGVRHRVARSR